MLDAQQIDALMGAEVRDNSGDKVGKVAHVYLSNADHQIEWLTVSTGLFGTKESFAPGRDASWSDDAVHLTVSKDQVKDAPQVSDDGALSSSQENDLYTHYNLADSDTTDTTQQAPPADQDRHEQQNRTDHQANHDATDEAMTRSKEELRVSTQSGEVGKARLRKYVTTEQQTVTVPVRHEEVTLTREPITEADRDQAGGEPSISEEEHEVVLHAEKPVVTTEAVAVERVALGKETVTEDQQVSGEVREEHIEMDNDSDIDKRTEQPRNQ